MPCSKWDLSSQPRDWTCAPCIPALEVPKFSLLSSVPYSRAGGWLPGATVIRGLEFSVSSEHWRIDAFKLVLEKTLESPLDCKIKPVNPKRNQPQIFTGGIDAEAETNTLATWREELTNWKRPWCGERLKAGGEGDDRGWDGWMASRTQWTWVWVNSGSWWWTRRPGVLQFMGLQRIRHNWGTLVYNNRRDLRLNQSALANDLVNRDYGMKPP